MGIYKKHLLQVITLEMLIRSLQGKNKESNGSQEAPDIVSFAFEGRASGTAEPNAIKSVPVAGECPACDITNVIHG